MLVAPFKQCQIPRPTPSVAAGDILMFPVRCWQVLYILAHFDRPLQHL